MFHQKGNKVEKGRTTIVVKRGMKENGKEGDKGNEKHVGG